MRRFRIAAFTLTAVTSLTSNLSHARANEFSITCPCLENGLKHRLMIRHKGFGGDAMVVDSFRTKQFVLPLSCPLNCDRFSPADVGFSEVCSTACYYNRFRNGGERDIPVAGSRLSVKSGRNLDTK